jgi:hypothetical protein
MNLEILKRRAEMLTQKLMFLRREISYQSRSTSRMVKKSGVQFISTGANIGVKKTFLVP